MVEKPPAIKLLRAILAYVNTMKIPDIFNSLAMVANCSKSTKSIYLYKNLDSIPAFIEKKHMKICIYLPFLFFLYSTFIIIPRFQVNTYWSGWSRIRTRLKPVVTTRSNMGESIQTCLTDSSSLAGPLSLATTISNQIWLIGCGMVRYFHIFQFLFPFCNFT